MDIKKYIIINLCLLFLVGCSLPAWANEEIETDVEVIDQSETISDSGLPVVDVSENSINAIAEAVSESFTYAFQYYITLNNGMNIIIDTDTENALDNYHFVIYFDGTSYSYYISEASFTAADVVDNGDGSYDFTLIKSTQGIKAFPISGLRDGFVLEKQTFYSGSNVYVNPSKKACTIVYSNRSIVDEFGNTFYSAVSGDITVTHYVSFETGIDGYKIESIPVSEFELPEFDYEGYRFEGWFLDQELTQPYNSSYVFTDNTTLFAKAIELYDISFVNGFFDVVWESTNQIDLVFPETDIDSNFVFTGWYLNSDFTNQYTNDYVFTEDTVLYAKYVEISSATVFVRSLFDSFTALFEVEAIKYILSLFGLVFVIGMIKVIISSRF